MDSHQPLVVVDRLPQRAADAPWGTYEMTLFRQLSQPHPLSHAMSVFIHSFQVGETVRHSWSV